MIRGGKVVAITAGYDTAGKRDATRAFIPEAKRFTEYWRTYHFVHNDSENTAMHLIDNRKPIVERRRQTIAALRAQSEVKHLAIFCHAWRTGLQFGFKVKHVRAFARVIEEVAIDDAPIITLYCCSTAQGDTGGDGGGLRRGELARVPSEGVRLERGLLRAP